MINSKGLIGIVIIVLIVCALMKSSRFINIDDVWTSSRTASSMAAGDGHWGLTEEQHAVSDNAEKFGILSKVNYFVVDVTRSGMQGHE